MEVFPQSQTDKSQAFRHFQAEKPKRPTPAIYKQCQTVHSPHLPFKDARRVTAAALHGAALHQHWRGITINLTMLDAPQATEQTMRALLDHLRHWQERHDCPAYWLWVRENGARLGDHVHILAAVPMGAGRQLSDTLRRWLRGPSIRGDLPRGTLHTRPTSAHGWLVYVVKTITPTDAVKLHQKTGLRVPSQKPGGPVSGQRVGIARGLGPKAREQAATPAQYERIAL